MAKRIIVTGGSGYIGSAVCISLANQGYEVHAWMRGLSKSDPFADIVAVNSHKIDIYDPVQVKAGLSDINANEMIHLAWGGLPNFTSCHHIDHELVHQIAFVRTVLEGGIESLTHTGTCFEYGDQCGELHEDMLCEPTNPYGYAKLALLHYIRFLQSEMPFRYKWLRLFYMYGAGQGEKSLYTLLKAAQQRGDVSFDMSLGHQIRDFSPVEEIVAKVVAVHQSSAADGVYNICSGQPVSVRQLVENWAEAMNYDVTLNLGKFAIPDYEPLAFWGSDTKTRKIIEKIQSV